MEGSGMAFLGKVTFLVTVSGNLTRPRLSESYRARNLCAVLLI